MAPTNEKVSNHIPDDVAFSILSKLPLKSLRRFTCVRKSWSLLFENPHFMTMFRDNFISKRHSFYDDTCLLLKQTTPFPECHSALYMLSGENRVKLDWPPPFQKDDTDIIDIDILGSGINGILCLYEDFVDEKTIVLWNPATEEFKVIPHSPIESPLPGVIVGVTLHGFGYDLVRDDYKLVHNTCFYPADDDFERDRANVPLRFELPDPVWEVYSLRSNSWRKLNDVDMFYHYMGFLGLGSNMYLNGMCHWLGIAFGGEEREEYLVSFDLTNEMFYRTLVPLDIIMNHNGGLDHGWTRELLVSLNGSIALISYYEKTSSFHISILGELGVKESWIKLFVIGPLPCVEVPIGVGKMGDIFFVKEDKELAWFDLSTQRIQEIGFKGVLACSQTIIYKEKLFSIGEMNNLLFL